jgi:hypothetical protein
MDLLLLFLAVLNGGLAVLDYSNGAVDGGSLLSAALGGFLACQFIYHTIGDRS